MYLSRLLLTGEQLQNPYEIHRHLWSAFPETPDQARDFLFRVEQCSSRKAQVLMQSLRPPTQETTALHILASKTFELNVLEGVALRFFIIANPIKTIIDQQGRLDRKNAIKKCRVPLISENEQVAWLKRKLEGIAWVNTVDIEKQLPLYFRKQGKPGKIQPYAFKGVLQPVDTEKFSQLIQQGIGPAKAFGCGLLSLARG